MTLLITNLILIILNITKSIYANTNHNQTNKYVNASTNNQIVANYIN